MAPCNEIGLESPVEAARNRGGSCPDPAKSTGREPAHGDFEVRASVDQTVLSGVDAFPFDDSCPRTVAPGGVEVPYPDGKITDKGCGEKNPDKTFGAPVRVDIVDEH